MNVDGAALVILIIVSLGLLMVLLELSDRLSPKIGLMSQAIGVIATLSLFVILWPVFFKYYYASMSPLRLLITVPFNLFGAYVVAGAISMAVATLGGILRIAGRGIARAGHAFARAVEWFWSG